MNCNYVVNMETSVNGKRRDLYIECVVVDGEVLILSVKDLYTDDELYFESATEVSIDGDKKVVDEVYRECEREAAERIEIKQEAARDAAVDAKIMEKAGK